MNGYLLVDKLAGWTSYDVVAKVRGILRQAQSSESLAKSGLTASSPQLSAHGSKIRVGHTGTLDPFATGLLVLVVGSYTKKAADFSKLDKTYEAEITLGSNSSTGDIDGQITQKRTKTPNETAVREVLGLFTGEIMQTPHAYSAVKIDGQRAYKLAREGKTPQLEPRKVTIYSLEMVNYSYPTLKIKTKVSSGTYIRSLAEDIGEKLGTGAYLSALRRTEVGGFNVESAIDVINIDYPLIQQKLSA